MQQAKRCNTISSTMESSPSAILPCMLLASELAPDIVIQDSWERVLSVILSLVSMIISFFPLMNHVTNTHATLRKVCLKLLGT